MKKDDKRQRIPNCYKMFIDIITLILIFKKDEYFMNNNCN